MIIIYFLFSLVGAHFIYFGIDTVLTETDSVACVVLGAVYALGGIFLIGYMGAEAGEYYRWWR